MILVLHFYLVWSCSLSPTLCISGEHEIVFSKFQWKLCMPKFTLMLAYSRVNPCFERCFLVCVCVYMYISHDSLWESAVHPDLEIRDFYGAPLSSSGNHHFFRKATLTALLHCPYSLTLSSSWYYFIFFTHIFLISFFLPLFSFSFFLFLAQCFFFFILLPQWTQLRKKFQYIILFSIPRSYSIIWMYGT